LLIEQISHYTTVPFSSPQAVSRLICTASPGGLAEMFAEEKARLFNVWRLIPRAVPGHCKNLAAILGLPEFDKK
jgi:hypothetical protein